MKEDQKEVQSLTEQKDFSQETAESADSKKERFSTFTQFKSKKGRVRFITRVAMFSCLATIFYIWLKFPLPFFPTFLEVNFSNLFVLMGSLLTGPIGGAVIVLIRFVLKIIISPTSTGFVGELSDVLLGLTVALSSGITYAVKHTKKGGFLGILFAYLSIMIVGVLENWLIVMPMYINLFGGKGPIIGCMSMYPNVTEDNMMVIYLFGACLPFNALVGFVNCGLAALVYKKTSTILKRIGI